MNYTKLIRYGNNIEIFEYELAPPPHRRRIRKKDKEKDEGKIFAKRKDNVLQAKRNFRRLKNQKAYASSRNIQRPIIDTMIMPTLYQFVGENDLPILDEKYPTRRMGQCHRRWFKTSQQNIEGVI